MEVKQIQWCYGQPGELTVEYTGVTGNSEMLISTGLNTSGVKNRELALCLRNGTRLATVNVTQDYAVFYDVFVDDDNAYLIDNINDTLYFNTKIT